LYRWMYPTWEEKVQIWFYLYRKPFLKLKVTNKQELRAFCLELIERNTRNYTVDYESYITYTGHFGKAFLDARMTLPLRLPPEWRHISSMEPKLQVEYNPVGNIVAYCIKLTKLFNELTLNGKISLETRLLEDFGVFASDPNYMSLDKLKDTLELFECLSDLQDTRNDLGLTNKKKPTKKFKLKKEMDIMRKIGQSLLNYCREEKIFVPTS